MNKRKSFLALVLVCALCMLPMFGAVKASADVAIDPYERFVDVTADPGILTSDEPMELHAILKEAANESGLNIGVYILQELGGKSAQATADEYLESRFGTSNDSVALLIVRGTGNGDGAWQFSTTGKAIRVMYDSAQIETWARIQDAVKSDNYVSAIKSYASSVVEFSNEYEGNDVTRGPKPGLTGIIAVVVGAISGLIRGSALKSELKSVAVATTATDCIKKDSFKLTRSGDVFLYRTVKRTQRSTEDKTSTTHTSESGTTHGGVGGTF